MNKNAQTMEQIHLALSKNKITGADNRCVDVAVTLRVYPDGHGHIYMSDGIDFQVNGVKEATDLVSELWHKAQSKANELASTEE